MYGRWNFGEDSRPYVPYSWYTYYRYTRNVEHNIGNWQVEYIEYIHIPPNIPSNDNYSQRVQVPIHQILRPKVLL